MWPQGKTRQPDPYPWRVEEEPVLVLDEEDFVPAVELVGELEHAVKWPAEHWHLAFQGQLRTVAEADARLLGERLGAARRAPDPAPWRREPTAGHDRHFSREEANAALPSCARCCSSSATPRTC